MAIGRLTVNTGSKGKATSHAAYVARTGVYEKYVEQGEVLEAQGSGNMPTWAEHDPSIFWNCTDAYERANGTAYREYLISLPRELSTEQRIELVDAFVALEMQDRHAYQYAIHVPRASDGLDNPHVHLMFSERRNDGIARDPEAFFKRYNAKSPEKGGAQKGVGEIPHSKLTQREQGAELKAMRGRWEVMANRALEQAGHSVRISMLSYRERGLDIQPEPKQLPSAWMKDGKRSILEFRAARKAELEVRRDPGVIIERVSSMKALFTRADLYREVNKVTDDVEVFNDIKATLDVHPDLIVLETGRKSGASNEQLTTQSVLNSEISIQALGDVLVGSGEFSLPEKVVDRALLRTPILSDEQVLAVKHVVRESRLSMITGVAGAGKSTTLSVVREGYEAGGFRVSGMALAGKAADELQQSSGIESRTIASWLYRYDQGDIALSKKDVIVIDEAGMVNNATMERVLDAVNRSGAKAILVGDSEQLQPIQAGCPFRSLSDDHGVAEITTVRRQREVWQRRATQDLSRGNGRAALARYRHKGCVFKGESDALVGQVVENYLSKPDSSAVILAHRNVDVGMLNEAVRDERKQRGELARVKRVGPANLELGVGDRVVFTKNDSKLGVKNGQFGEVVTLARIGSSVGVKLDNGRLVEFSASSYSDIAHGYASTIHKSQGMTVDRAMLWGSASLDRHLGYVAMSRHRDRLDVYQPLEATRVRSLEACLSRSTRAVSVGAVVRQRGLEYAQGIDGRTRLKSTYPTAAVVDEATGLRTEAETYAQAFVVKQTAELKLAANEATNALSDHRENEPPGRRKRDALMPGANQRWVDWKGQDLALASAAKEAEGNVESWRFSVERKDHEQSVVEARLNTQLPDLLTAAGGVERSGDGGIVITDRYPEIAREKASTALWQAKSKARSFIENKQRHCVDDVERAETRLAHHRSHEPTDSKFQEIMYQGPKARREAWDAELPAYEVGVQQAKDTLQQWEASIKDGSYEKNLIWEEFSVNAPDANQANQLVLKAEQKRAEFAKDVRQYDRLEKALESTLERPLKKDVEKTRDQLLVKFDRDSYRERLPSRVREQAKQHTNAVRKAQDLKRSLSRGRGMGW